MLAFEDMMGGRVVRAPVPRTASESRLGSSPRVKSEPGLGSSPRSEGYRCRTLYCKTSASEGGGQGGWKARQSDGSQRTCSTPPPPSLSLSAGKYRLCMSAGTCRLSGSRSFHPRGGIYCVNCVNLPSCVTRSVSSLRNPSWIDLVLCTSVGTCCQSACVSRN
jgi:hypothetical protein